MPSVPPAAGVRQRRAYLDWMRGLAVLVMIEAHVIDSWTRPGARRSPAFMWAIIVGGFGAPLFLFLAGVSVSLSAGSKFARTGDRAAASAAVMRRGVWVFALAFLFRLQAWILGMASPWSLLTVDILNIMGPGIAAAAALWGAGNTPRARVWGFGAATLAVAFASPIVRHAPLLDAWPQPLADYLRPSPGRSNFCLFPWVAFVFAGGLVGALVDAARTGAAEQRLNRRFLMWGAALAACAYAASWLPSPYPRSEFWGSSPAFFLLRTGLISTAVGAAWEWNAWRGARPAGVPGAAETPSVAARRSPMQLLGRSSLFIYWIHVEMVYGLISLPLHRALPLPAAFAALGVFTLFMVGCATLKDRFLASRSRQKEPPPTPACLAS